MKETVIVKYKEESKHIHQHLINIESFLPALYSWLCVVPPPYTHTFEVGKGQLQFQQVQLDSFQCTCCRHSINHTFQTADWCSLDL